MWAQLITFRVKPGTEGQVKDMIEHPITTAQADPHFLQELVMSDQRDPMSAVIGR